jgi:hypothetical protein
MASAFSHAVAALSIGACFYRRQIPKRVWVAGVLCSVIPDLDAIGFHFGIHYGEFWGHRGFAHSLVFAALLAGVVALAIFRHGVAVAPGEQKVQGGRISFRRQDKQDFYVWSTAGDERRNGHPAHFRSEYKHTSMSDRGRVQAAPDRRRRCPNRRCSSPLPRAIRCRPRTGG